MEAGEREIWFSREVKGDVWDFTAGSGTGNMPISNIFQNREENLSTNSLALFVNEQRTTKTLSNNYTLSTVCIIFDCKLQIRQLLWDLPLPLASGDCLIFFNWDTSTRRTNDMHIWWHTYSVNWLCFIAFGGLYQLKVLLF